MYKRKLKKKWEPNWLVLSVHATKKVQILFFSLLLGSRKKKEKEMFGSCITTEVMTVAAAY